MIAVLAGDYKEFLNCKKEFGESDLIYITREEQCYGKFFDDYIKYGTYYMNPRHEQLKAVIKSRIR